MNKRIPKLNKNGASVAVGILLWVLAAIFFNMDKIYLNISLTRLSGRLQDGYVELTWCEEAIPTKSSHDDPESPLTCQRSGTVLTLLLEPVRNVGRNQVCYIYRLITLGRFCE